MSKVFAGSVLLPGEEGPGLQASVEMSDTDVRLLAGADEIGAWSSADLDVKPSGKGAFRLGLGGEEIFFTPSSPAKFAEAMAVPLQPDSGSKKKKQKYDIDAAIDEAIANVKPLTSADGDDDILSAPLLTTIVVVSTGLMAGLIGLTFLL